MIRLLLPAILVFFTILPRYSYSYCIHNKMSANTFLNVTQILGQNPDDNGIHTFRQPSIHTGSKACCPYTDPICSEKAEKDARVLLQVAYAGPQVDNPSEGLRLIWCTAGGHIEAKGKANDVTYEVYDQDQKHLRSYT